MEFLNLNNGLVLSGTGVVYLGSGNLTVNDRQSGMSGGSLSIGSQYVGRAAALACSRSPAGPTPSPNDLYLGCTAADSGPTTLTAESSSSRP